MGYHHAVCKRVWVVGGYVKPVVRRRRAPTGMNVRACICLFTHYIHTYISLSHTHAHTHTQTHTHITVEQLRNGLVMGLSLSPPPSLNHDAQWPDNDCHQICSAHRVPPPAIRETTHKISYFKCWFWQFICLKLSLSLAAYWNFVLELSVSVTIPMHLRATMPKAKRQVIDMVRAATQIYTKHQ